ncbi:hypothetical protein KI387_038535, partial [Taxus chinensis]
SLRKNSFNISLFTLENSSISFKPDIPANSSGDGEPDLEKRAWRSLPLPKFL